MWQTPAEIGLTDQNKINKIIEQLWNEEMSRSKRSCGDCGVEVGQQHDEGCDVARCTNCGDQRLSCGCIDVGEPEEWTGLWPGVKTAYEKKLISTFDGGKTWSFDLNRAAVIDQTR
jgi:hypothetical protein